MKNREINKRIKEVGIEFAKWLHPMGLIYVGDDTKEAPGKDLWETNDGEWLTMEELYQKFCNTFTGFKNSEGKKTNIGGSRG